MAKEKSPYELYKTAFKSETGMEADVNFELYMQYINMRSNYGQAIQLKEIANKLELIEAAVKGLTRP